VDVRQKSTTKKSNSKEGYGGLNLVARNQYPRENKSGVYGGQVSKGEESEESKGDRIVG